MLSLNCIVCKKPFYVRSEKESLTRKYCSRECYKSGIQSVPVPIQCLHCKSIFYVKPGVRRKFCSSKCQHENCKVTVHLYPEKGFRKSGNLKKKYWNLHARSTKRGFTEICKLDEFINWYRFQRKECCYCGIQEETWINLYSGFQNKFSLTVDRKNNLEGYVIKNIVLACAQCNYTKGDALSYEEMKEIGEKYMKPKWQKKLIESEPKVAV